jgi:site-specific DNA-cytosine methylase
MAIKLLIGGSPCTHWSIAQKNNRETEPSGIGWELFKNYLIAKEKFKPNFFLYENNKSAAQAIKDQIAKELGVGVDPKVRFTYINSALVSAQNRQRFYVTNFGDIEQPKDRGILLKDILEYGFDLSQRDKSYCLTATYNGATAINTLERKQRPMVAEPLAFSMTGTFGNRNASVSEKAYCLAANPSSDMSARCIEPVRVGCYPSPDGTLKNSQGMRLYSIEGKSVNLTANGGGLGAKTGLYAIPVNTTANGDKARTLMAGYYKYGTATLITNAGFKGGTTAISEPVGFSTPVEWNKNGIPTKAVSCADGKTYTVYEVKDGQISIKGKHYPIKLPDGFYIIRKLTVTECCRLQTLPDDYCKAVSATQGYKGLGNGWTAEVIIHLLNRALKDVPRNEEIVVLSLYDGIGTGRYCLDKMGFTNVKYYAYEIDKYAMAIANDNYPDIIQCGDAFAVREDSWKPPNTSSEWLDELLGGITSSN